MITRFLPVFLMFCEDMDTKRKNIQCNVLRILYVVAPGANDVCDEAGHQSCLEAPNLGLKPGPVPERSVGLVIEQGSHRSWVMESISGLMGMGKWGRLTDLGQEILLSL